MVQLFMEENRKFLPKNGNVLQVLNRVRTPHLTKGSLYEKSGHFDHYQDAMYPSMDVRWYGITM
jgi:Threonyl-tRNA synthetase